MVTGGDELPVLGRCRRPRESRRVIRVAIDGQIYHDAWPEPTPPGSEVYLIPQISGG